MKHGVHFFLVSDKKMVNKTLRGETMRGWVCSELRSGTHILFDETCGYTCFLIVGLKILQEYITAIPSFVV